ncbi:Protein BYPASS-related [Cinnamomum micranthum f. kanehirae]|uniref:Protein BYPASS-related n=1 Tax=Cinnamomum micranthum f. kanehirae TaxID=337451 RepID=A0A443PAJ1_9MAGN|nr:Protein BYPASS-related [Cinnamomum micranthum f. kanehirae]
MPVTENPGGFLGRSILSIRRNQVASMEGGHDQELEDIDLFTKHIADRFHELSPLNEENKDDNKSLLSLPWLRKLLDAFLCCEAEFKAMIILRRNPSHMAKPPFDRLITEMLDRSVKALDICNAISHGIDSAHHWQKRAEIAVLALEQRPLSEGQFRRAKKALTTLVATMNHDDKGGKTTERSWSFGMRGSVAPTGKDRTSGAHLRSLSWSVSKTWSASKQLQAMAANLAAPRGADMNGLALPIYTMSTVLMFVAWVLVTAIPCQDRGGLNMHFPVPPKQLAWAGPMISLQEKIAEEWRKREKKSFVGLMEELQRLEKCASGLIELGETIQFPLEEEKMEEIQVQANDLADTCRSLEEELVPFQRQVREVFHGIVRSRTEVLDFMGQAQANRVSTPVLH